MADFCKVSLNSVRVERVPWMCPQPANEHSDVGVYETKTVWHPLGV